MIWDGQNLNDGMLGDVHTCICYKVIHFLQQACEHALLERNVQCRKAMGHILFSTVERIDPHSVYICNSVLLICGNRDLCYHV